MTQEPVRVVVVERKRSGLGCLGTLAVLALIGLAIEYWYASLGIAVLVGVVALVANAQHGDKKKQQPAQASIVPAAPGAVEAETVATTAPLAGSARVRLDSPGEKKIQVIKVVRAATGLSLKEAKALVDHVPSVVAVGWSIEEAERLCAELGAAGATAVVEAASMPPRSMAVPEPATTTPPSGGAEVAAQLQQLADLHDRGALSDDEFVAAKARVLGA